MTKIISIICLFLCITFFVKGQTIQSDTLLKITYYPSFHNASQLTLYKENNIPKGIFKTISVDNGKPKYDTAFAKISNETYEKYVTFFSTYHFPGSSENKYPDTTKTIEIGFDGINITGMYYSDTTKKIFKFWSPYHDTKSMSLFKMTLADMDKYFKTPINKKYLKWLRMYSK